MISSLHLHILTLIYSNAIYSNHYHPNFHYQNPHETVLAVCCTKAFNFFC